MPSLKAVGTSVESRCSTKSSNPIYPFNCMSEDKIRKRKQGRSLRPSNQNLLKTGKSFFGEKLVISPPGISQKSFFTWNRRTHVRKSPFISTLEVHHRRDNFDTMQLISSPIKVVVTGMAASMGSILLCGASKGRRFLYPLRVIFTST